MGLARGFDYCGGVCVGMACFGVVCDCARWCLFGLIWCWVWWLIWVLGLYVVWAMLVFDCYVLVVLVVAVLLQV